MPRSYPPGIRRHVVELARAGTRVKQLAATFGMSEAAIYLWLKQERIDRGEIDVLSTDQAMELAAAKRRIRQLETELAVSRKVNEILRGSGSGPKAFTR
jgi:transposase-like protein